MKTFIKSLIREYFDDYDNFDELLYPRKNNSSKFKKELNSLPEVITLYRILIADSPEAIDKEFPGSHYSMDKNNLLKTHSYLKNKKYFLLTVKANKKMINMKKTIDNNIQFPNEKEITLKNKGKGVKIISIDALT